MANNEPMTAARRVAIKARCDAATPGPWVVSSEYASGVDLGYKPDHERTWGYGCSNDFVCDLNDGEYHEYHNKAEQMANASFIAHAREDVPALLAEVELWQRVARYLAKKLTHDDGSENSGFPSGKWQGATYDDCCSLYSTREEAVQSWIDEAEREVGDDREEEPLTDEQLVAIRSRLNGVSLGEWIHGYSLDVKCNTITCEGMHLLWFVHPDPLKNDKNMEFVASARQDMGALLEEAERLRVENQRLEKSIDWLVSKRFPCPRDGSQCYKEIAIRNDTTYAENICEQHWRDAALRAAMKEEKEGNHE